MARVSELIRALQILFPNGEGFIAAASHDLISLSEYPEPDAAIKAGIAQSFDPEYPDEPHICLVEVPQCFWMEDYGCWVMYC